MWTDIKADLLKQEFVCFRSPYKQLTSCQAQKTCDSVAGNLQDFSITVIDDDGNSQTISISSSVYLYQINGGDSCECLLSESEESSEAFILGMPFFRNFVVSLDYYDETIALYGKDVKSPIIPDGVDPVDPVDPTDGSTGLGGGVIFAIIFAVFIVIAGMGAISYHCKKKSERIQAQATNNDIITAIERGSFVNPTGDLNVTQSFRESMLTDTPDE